MILEKTVKCLIDYLRRHRPSKSRWLSFTPSRVYRWCLKNNSCFDVTWVVFANILLAVLCSDQDSGEVSCVRVRNSMVRITVSRSLIEKLTSRSLDELVECLWREKNILKCLQS